MVDVDESSVLQLQPTTKKQEETTQPVSLQQQQEQQLQDDLELVKQQQMLSMKEDKQLLLSSSVEKQQRRRQASLPSSSTLSLFFDTTATATVITSGESSEITRKDDDTGTGTSNCTDNDNDNDNDDTLSVVADDDRKVRFSTHDDHNDDDDAMAGEPHCVFYEPRKSYELPTHMSTLWYTQWNLNQVAAERTHTVEIMCPSGVEPLPDNPLYCLRGLEIQYSKALAEQRYFQRKFFKAVVFNEQAVERQRLQPQPQPQQATDTTTATVVDLPAQIYQQAQAYSGTALQQAQQRAVQDAQEAALYQREVVVVAALPGKVWWKKTSKKHSKKR